MFWAVSHVILEEKKDTETDENITNGENLRQRIRPWQGDNICQQFKLCGGHQRHVFEIKR